MAKALPKSPADYITPLNINGLEGRVLHLPNTKKKHEILFVYGHHSSLERWWGIMLVMNKYASVTMPDLPGFGGMDPFYKIGKKPTIDNLADYLAAFVKLRYKRKKIIIAGMSIGFVVATRMLQKYPELTKKVILLVSIVGFAHHDDFLFSKPRFYAYLYGTRLLSHRLPAKVFRYTALHPTILRTFYGKTNNAKHKFKQAKDLVEVKKLQDIEIGLWHDNDPRTWAFTTTEILKLDNCTQQVALPVWHVGAKADHFFDAYRVEQHMQVIFSGFNKSEFDSTTHAPSVLATEKDAAPFLPPALRRKLRSLG